MRAGDGQRYAGPPKQDAPRPLTPRWPMCHTGFALERSLIGIAYAPNVMLEVTVQRVSPMSVRRPFMGEWLVPFDEETSLARVT
jgi:hypothetical protein